MSGHAVRPPSLKAAQAIEALERLGSITLVAEELALSRSAVSHMLRRLEDDLGFALVEPAGRGVRLTARGDRFAEAARRALQTLAEAAVDEPQLSGALSVTCPPGLATFWLSERIDPFLRRYPDLRLTVSATRRLGGMQIGRADVDIAFGDASEMQDGARLLSRVSLFPVCAPSVLSGEPGIRRASDLAQFRLLHLITSVDWDRWLAAAGAVEVDAEAGVVFSDMPMVQHAAAAGQGVALGDDITAAGALAQGDLVRPFALSIPSRWSYFIRINTRGPSQLAATAFADWMSREMQTASKLRQSE